MRNRLSSPLAYAEYEYKLTKEVVISLLNSWHINLENKELIDIGCGYGGSSVAFVEQGCQCVGIDIDENLLEFSKKFARKRNIRMAFFKQDICNLSSSFLKKKKYDIAILRDVIEHIHNPENVLFNISKLLKEKGLLYISFPPWWCPFGGHQHLLKSIIRFVPYVHLLPDYIFSRLLTKGEYGELVKSARSNKISIDKFEKLITASGFRIRKKELYLMRPVFKIRYGVPAIKMKIDIPLIREFMTSGCIYLLIKPEA